MRIYKCNPRSGIKVTLLDGRILTTLEEIQQEEASREEDIVVRVCIVEEYINCHGSKDMYIEYTEVEEED